MNKSTAFFLTLFLGLASNLAAQSCDELKVIIDKTYGFKPSKLTSEQISAKSAELDKVWNLIGTNQKELLACLRSEISLRKSDSFFRFNASNLLYKHDQSIETKKLMIETFSEADLSDINLRYWLPYMAEFGKDGLDVSKAGETWIRFPKPLYYLPQHGTRPIDKGIGALGIYASMDESIATPALARLAAEENTDFRSIVLVILVNQATPESDVAVLGLSNKLPIPLYERLKQDVTNPKLMEPRQGKPKTSRNEFLKAMKELVDGKPDLWNKLTVDVSDGEKDMVAVMTIEDLFLIRKVRRYYAANATPHSLDWYTTLAQVINTIRAKSPTTKTNN
ncbi:MAG: hypothetical protein ABIP78_00035 [Pyrinomonadaceae bacterium]